MSGSSDFWKNITKPTGTGKLTVEMVRQVYGIDVREDVSDD